MAATNPDFIAVETDGDHWLIEVKADKEVQTPDVQGKREAAERWANHVSVAEVVNARWHYLLGAEADIARAKGDWGALKQGASL